MSAAAILKGLITTTKGNVAQGMRGAHAGAAAHGLKIPVGEKAAMLSSMTRKEAVQAWNALGPAKQETLRNAAKHFGAGAGAGAVGAAVLT